MKTQNTMTQAYVGSGSDIIFGFGELFIYLLSTTDPNTSAAW